MTELDTAIYRRLQDVDVVIRLDKAGVAMRAVRKQTWTETISFEELAKVLLEQMGLRLTEAEWSDPFETLRRLAYHQSVHGPVGRAR